MKILQVCPKFYHSAASGSTKVAYEISNELLRRGHVVTVYTSDMRDKYTKMSSGSERENGVLVHRFRSICTVLTREMKVFVTPTIISKLRNEIRSFDIIHMHEYQSFQNVVVYFYARRYRIPYVLQAHGSIPRKEKRFRKWLYDVIFGYRILKNASKVIALSETEVKSYQQAGVPRRKISVIPNGTYLLGYSDQIPSVSFKSLFKIPKTEQIVLYLGRIHQSKGLGLLAEAFDIVARQMDRVKLVVIGPDDGYLATFARLIANMQMGDKVLLTGFLDNKLKMSALMESRVFVTPYFSGFPLTFLEACMMGCPIVTTSHELDWIHNNVGCVSKDSPPALAEAILSILQDETIHKQLQNNCKSMVKNFEISAVIIQLERTYISVAG